MKLTKWKTITDEENGKKHNGTKGTGNSKQSPCCESSKGDTETKNDRHVMTSHTVQDLVSYHKPLFNLRMLFPISYTGKF